MGVRKECFQTKIKEFIIPYFVLNTVLTTDLDPEYTKIREF
jgi:hypothetical protein